MSTKLGSISWDCPYIGTVGKSLWKNMKCDPCLPFLKWRTERVRGLSQVTIATEEEGNKFNQSFSIPCAHFHVFIWEFQIQAEEITSHNLFMFTGTYLPVCIGKKPFSFATCTVPYRRIPKTLQKRWMNRNVSSWFKNIKYNHRLGT